MQIDYEEKTVKAMVEIQSRLNELRLVPVHHRVPELQVSALRRGLVLGVSKEGYASMTVNILLLALPGALVIDYQRRIVHDAMQTESFKAKAAKSESTAKGMGELTKLLIYLRVETESRL